MSKKLFIIALAMVLASLAYWFFSRETTNIATNTISDAQPANTISYGTYTVFLDEAGCKGKEATLEIEEGSAYLTEDFKGCEVSKQSYVRGGPWKLAGSSLNIDFIDNNNLKSNLTLTLNTDSSGKQIFNYTQTNGTQKTFTPLQLTIYTNSKGEEMATQQGFFGETSFVRVWGSTKEIIATLYAKEIEDKKAKTKSTVYTDDVYTLEFSTSTAKLTTSTTTEILTKK